MTAIGSLLFCTDCGNILESNKNRSEFVTCSYCGTKNKDTSEKVIVTTSKPSAFPSTLRTKLRSNLQEFTESDVQMEATVKMTCDNCGNDEVTYYQKQIRSADEGTTVFYTCVTCGHKWNTNN